MTPSVPRDEPEAASQALADPRVQRLVERGEEMGCVNLSELSELVQKRIQPSCGQADGIDGVERGRGHSLGHLEG